MIGNDQLSAYLDGELSLAEAQSVEAALAADADLRGQLERMRRTDRGVKTAMDALLAQPASDRLAQAIRAATAASEGKSDNVVAFKPRSSWPRKALWPTAIAAALVGGVMVGQQMPAGGSDWSTPNGEAAPVAGRSMAAALNGAASGAHVTLASNQIMTPVMTFTSRDGALCRQFDMAGAKGRQSALACRNSDRAWGLVALSTTRSAGGGYQTASGPGDDVVSAVADRLIKGEPMDAAAEAVALSRR